VVSGQYVESVQITALVVGPARNRVYAGATNGGVWFSSHGGASWSPLDDYVTSPSLFGGAAEADSLAIGALAINFGMSAIGDEVCVGTGDPNDSYDPGRWGLRVTPMASGTWDSGSGRTDPFGRTRAYWNAYQLVEFVAASGGAIRGERRQVGRAN
jgi:hypothetical protein